MNKAILMGRMTRDPEIRYSNGPEQTAVGRFTLAVDRRGQRQGNQQNADFIPCVAFGKKAEFVEKYTHKGTKVIVEGEKGEKEGEEMRLRDAAKWIKEKITGKKTEETPVLTPMIATEEDIERAKKMDREIEEMEKKSALVAPIVTSQAEMEHLQRFEAGSKQIAEMTGKPHEEVAEAILKVTTETSASLEEATEQVRERMELQAEVAAEAKEESDTPFVQRWAEALGMTVQELEQQTGWTAEQLEQNIIDSSRIITTELVKAQRLMKILMTNNGRRRKGIPMVRRQQLLRAERNQRRRRSENRKES